MEEKPRTTPYPLRMPEELRTALESAALIGNRSLHSEVVARLQSTFKEPGTAVQFSRADDASEALFANIRKLREEGESKDATIEALRHEIELRIESAAIQKQLVQTQSTLIFALESHMVDLVRQLPDELVTDEIRQLAQTCNFDLEMERAVEHARSLGENPDGIEDAQVNAMKYPVTVRGKKTEVTIRRERTERLDSDRNSTKADKSN